MALYSNVKIGGSVTRKIVIVTLLVLICYYFFYYSQNKQLTLYDIQTFLGNSIFVIALQNTPIIFL